MHLMKRPDVRMLEIGSYEGKSAIWFLENILTGPGAGITCVDGFWPPYGEVFDRNIALSGHAGRVQKLAGRTDEVLPRIDATFDAIYIDAGHREQEVWEDAQHAWRLAKPGATVIFDDYLWQPHLPLEERPQRAIDRFLSERGGELTLLYRGYQVIVRKRTPLGEK